MTNKQWKHLIPTVTVRFSTALRKRRARLGKSQNTLAKELKVSTSVISRLEAGLTSPVKISVAQYAKALKTAPEAVTKWI